MTVALKMGWKIAEERDKGLGMILDHLEIRVIERDCPQKAERKVLSPIWDHTELWTGEPLGLYKTWA